MIFQIIVLVMSAVVHEYAHGWAAFQLGDPTAKDEGRLTINPLKHLDPFSSFLLPLITYFTFGFAFGAAKPVPYNPYNLSNQKYGPAIVALAGPLANFLTALFFALFIRLSYVANLPFINDITFSLLQIVIYINLMLMIFNLIPIPPLDGSKVILPFLPADWQEKILSIERFGFILLFVFIMFGFNIIIPVIDFLFKLLTGLQ